MSINMGNCFGILPERVRFSIRINCFNHDVDVSDVVDNTTTNQEKEEKEDEDENHVVDSLIAINHEEEDDNL